MKTESNNKVRTMIVSASGMTIICGAYGVFAAIAGGIIGLAIGYYASSKTL